MLGIKARRVNFVSETGLRDVFSSDCIVWIRPPDDHHLWVYMNAGDGSVPIIRSVQFDQKELLSDWVTRNGFDVDKLHLYKHEQPYPKEWKSLKMGQLAAHSEEVS